MIMKANKQIGFIYKNEESIDEILKDGDVVFERGFLREKTSTTLPITFGGVGKDLKDYKVYGNTVQSKLPSGYTQVDYIESSGTQYIDTGVNADINLDIKIDMQYTNINASNNDTNFGAIYHDGSIYRRYHAVKNNGKFSWYVLSNVNTIVSFDILRHTFYIKASERKIVFDEVEYNMVETTQTNPNINFWLFGRNSNDSNLIFYISSRLYSCQMYYNNELVRDFIPCYRNSDNEVGLYDLVNNVFYTNQGTGVFTYGSVAPTPDAPIEIVSCGDRTNNLIPTNPDDWEQGGIEARTGSQIESTVRLRNKDYCEIENDKDYYVSLESLNYSYVNIILYDNNKSYLGQYYNIDNRINGTNKIKINIPSLSIANVKYMRVVVKKTNSTTIIPEEISTIKPMITLGDTKLDFEPYGYKIPVNVRSENLISQTIYQTNTNLNDNGEMVSNNNYFVMKQTNIKPLSKYILSENQVVEMTGTNNTPIRVCAYDKNDNLISLVLKNVRTEVKRYSDEFTIPENTEYILISFRNTDSNTELVESIDTNIYLDEPLRRIDEYSDYIDFINGKVVRNIKEYVITSDDKLNNGSASQDGYARVGWGKRSEIAVSDFDKSLVICNKFLGVPQNDNTPSITGKRWQCSLSNTDEYKIMFRSGDLNLNNAELISLIKNNTKVCYPLLSPTEESITLPNIPTIDGNNTLNIETEITPSQVYIKYKSNE